MLSPDDTFPTAVPVAAVITAFNPDSALLTVCASVVDQVHLVVVVDDGSPDPDEAIFAECMALGVVVVRQGKNLGIGAALNAGISAVWAHPSSVPGTAILTLDQDSCVPEGYVAALTDALRAADRAGVAVSMVGPSQATGVRYARAATRGEIVFSREPIQSGLLIPAHTLETVGLFADELFIDGVDTEYFLRAESLGQRAVVAPGTSLKHRLGQRRVVRFLGREVPVVHAATFRYYYIARNRVILVRRYGRSAPRWAAGAVLRDLRHLIIVSVLVPGRPARLRETLAGLRDGLRSTTGARESSNRGSTSSSVRR